MNSAAGFDPGQRQIAGRYRLDRPLGRGGMGTVWLAYDRVLDRQVAVKEVSYPSVVSEDERRLLEERTMREARAAARLSSPRTTTVHDVVAEQGRPWIVMEYVESRTLAEVLSEFGALPPLAVARIGLDLLDALEAAHSVDVVHRDVKPGNVLLAPSGRAWLTDFGIATSLGDQTLTEQGVLLGSPSFMPPERARGEDVGPFADLWSLGATLYAAVEGRRPFDRGDPMATLLAVTTEPPAPVEQAGPLGPVLMGLLVKEPEQRMTGWQARAALSALIEGPPVQQAATQPTPLPSSPPRQEGDHGWPDSIARIDRDQVARLASAAGRSFARGAARAALAGVSAWQEQAGRKSAAQSQPVQSSSPSSRQGPAADRPSAAERPRVPQRPPEAERAMSLTPNSLRESGRRAVRWSVRVLVLISIGLVLGVALLVTLIVLALR